jgi:TonB family protein
MLHLVSLVLKINITEDVVKKRAPPAKKALVIKVSPQAFKIKKQIVQSEDSDRKKIVKGAYLSDKNRAFDRQTRARKNDIFNQGQPSGGSPPKGSKKVKLSDLGATPGEHPLKKSAEEYTKKKNGNGNNKADPSRNVSSTNDYLEDIPLGDMTNLNTVEYKYYGFYHRIRQKLEQFWGRSIQEKAQQLAKDGRQVKSADELITALQITLDHQGEIIGIRVMDTSGIKELDDAAIESFNDAGPFPNPPKGLVVDGKVTIEWGFVVKS